MSSDRKRLGLCRPPIAVPPDTSHDVAGGLRPGWPLLIPLVVDVLNCGEALVQRRGAQPAGPLGKELGKEKHDGLLCGRRKRKTALIAELAKSSHPRRYARRVFSERAFL